MSFLSKYNEYALESYLNGEYGEELRRKAQQVLYERGQKSVGLSQFGEDDMIKYLRERGWVVFRRRRQRCHCSE